MLRRKSRSRSFWSAVMPRLVPVKPSFFILSNTTGALDLCENLLGVGDLVASRDCGRGRLLLGRRSDFLHAALALGNVPELCDVADGALDDVALVVVDGVVGAVVAVNLEHVVTLDDIVSHDFSC